MQRLSGNLLRYSSVNFSPEILTNSNSHSYLASSLSRLVAFANLLMILRATRRHRGTFLDY
jgi:hypothetical protein